MSSEESSNLEKSSLEESTKQRVVATRLGIALDWWTVIAAIVLAILIRLNVLPAIGWFK